MKLAGRTGKAAWLDHAVKLYDALGLVLPLALVDEMYVLLRRVRGLDIEVLRAYTERLRERTEEPRPRRALRPPAPARPRTPGRLANERRSA